MGQSTPDKNTMQKHYIRDIYLETFSSILGVILDGPPFGCSLMKQ